MFKIVSLVLCFSVIVVNHGFASGHNHEPLTQEEKLKAYRAKQAEKKAQKSYNKTKAPSGKQMQKNNKGRDKGRG